MNILIAADYAAPSSGNFIASCVELGRVMKQSGDALYFVFPENKNTLSESSWVHWLEQEGYIVYLTKKNLSDGQVVDYLKAIIERHGIDILHIHFGLFHHVTVHHRKDLDVKVLVHDHMDFPANGNKIKQRLQTAARSILYRMNDVAIASVNPQKDRSYFFARHWYVPNGLSQIRNVTRSASREECRMKLGITTEDKMCLFLGWDTYRKGLDIAVKAVDKLRQTDNSVLLGIVGMGFPPDLGCLKFIADTTGVDPDSSWIRYFPSCEDMFAYHRAADAYLSASRSEAFSYGILEAISQNTPVAVSDIKGTSWCHKYSKTVVYPTEDPNACARAINQALSLGNSPSNADEIVDAYSIEKWCEQITCIYKSLTPRKG